MVLELPRGIRNNNPGNIDFSPAIKWQGLADPPYEIRNGKPGRFCSFKTPFWGLRALCKLLITYHTKKGCTTVRKIINRWAPPTENNTDAYVNAVAAHVGFRPDMRIQVMDAATLTLLSQAITKHENTGYDYELVEYKRAAAAALE